MDIQYICPLLEVFDMNTSLKFYCGLLGFSIHESAGSPDDMGWVWIKKGNTNLMLNTAYETADRPALPDPARVAVHKDTSLYLGCADVDQAYEELLAHGIKMDPPEITSYGMKQLYLRDPDGYNICFQWKHE